MYGTDTFNSKLTEVTKCLHILPDWRLSFDVRFSPTIKGNLSADLFGSEAYISGTGAAVDTEKGVEKY
jgi:hypothetical protein